VKLDSNIEAGLPVTYEEAEES